MTRRLDEGITDLAIALGYQQLAEELALNPLRHYSSLRGSFQKDFAADSPSWSETAPFNSPRTSRQSVLHRDFLYVIGGYSYKRSEGDYLRRRTVRCRRIYSPDWDGKTARGRL